MGGNPWSVDNPERKNPPRGESERFNVEPPESHDPKSFIREMQLAALEVCANLESWVYPWMMFQKQETPAAESRWEKKSQAKVKQ